MNILSLRLSLQARQTPENFTAQITASNYAQITASDVRLSTITSSVLLWQSAHSNLGQTLFLVLDSLCPTLFFLSMNLFLFQPLVCTFGLW